MSTSRTRAKADGELFKSTGIDDNATSTAVTIDANENVMVGTTATSGFQSSSSATGTIAYSGGAIASNVSGDAAAYFNRLGSSDGAIVNLRKSGTTVGSIGVDSGDNLYITGGSGGTGGLYIDDTQILPATSGPTLVDNTLNLGRAATRFKDLYLSGGVVFGPASASNVSSQTLDSYEEGSWTPTAKGGSTVITVNASEGYYTKIGQQVTVHGFLDTGTLNGATAGFKIDGLPFAVKGQNTRTSIEASGTVSYWAGFATAVNSVSCMAVDGNYISFAGLLGSTATVATDLSAVHVGQSADFRFSITYTAV